MLKKVKVGGVTYKITNEKNPHMDGAVCYGVCDQKELTITMNSDLNEQRYNQTLIHEIMHAVMDEAGLDLEDEEDIVNRISLVWYQVLTDNRFDFLKK